MPTYIWAAGGSDRIASLTPSHLSTVQNGYRSGTAFRPPLNAFLHEISLEIQSLQGNALTAGTGITISSNAITADFQQICFDMHNDTDCMSRIALGLRFNPLSMQRIAGGLTVDVTARNTLRAEIGPVAGNGIKVTGTTVAADVTQICIDMGLDADCMTRIAEGLRLSALSMQRIANGLAGDATATDTLRTAILDQTDNTKVGYVYTQHLRGDGITMSLPAGGQWRAIVVSMGGRRNTVAADATLGTGGNALQDSFEFSGGHVAGEFPGGTTFQISANDSSVASTSIFAVRIS